MSRTWSTRPSCSPATWRSMSYGARWTSQLPSAWTVLALGRREDRNRRMIQQPVTFPPLSGHSKVEMRIIRLSKTATVAAIALFASIVAFGNITDYGTNWAFVQHVLSMDTLFPTTTIKYRAIDAPALQTAAYVLVIAVETITAILCWIGAARLLLASGDAAT